MFTSRMVSCARIHFLEGRKQEIRANLALKQPKVRDGMRALKGVPDVPIRRWVACIIWWDHFGHAYNSLLKYGEKGPVNQLVRSCRGKEPYLIIPPAAWGMV